MNSGKELFFISTIFVLSGLCSFVPGIHVPEDVPINPMNDIKIIAAEKILQSHSGRIDEKDFLFQSGYCYKVKTGFNHSDFYQGSINLIPTSTYWKFPVSEVNSLQYLKKGKKGYASTLFVPYELSLPIVSILVNSDDFFSYENGIYVQGMQSDFVSSEMFYPSAWDKPANYYKKENDKRKVFFSYYDEDGNAKFSSFANAEISGKATRCFPQKSLRLSASKSLGTKEFNYSFFGDEKIYDALVLRNGGNDNTKSLFRDMLMQTLMKPSGVLTSSFQPCEVYLNGEYWGIHFLQNRLDENFISEKFNVKEKNITLVESWKLEKGSELEFNRLIKGVKNDENSFEELTELIDMKDLVSFLAAELFFANTDWPVNNLKMFKISDSNNDSKWKFALFDLDYGFGYTGEQAFETDMFEHLAEGKDLFSKMVNRLLKSDEFKAMLRIELEKTCSNYCSMDKMNSGIAELKKDLQGAIENHTARWGKPATVTEWETEVKKLNDFAAKRSDVMMNQIKKYLN